jgi:hypothetical protein
MNPIDDLLSAVFYRLSCPEPEVLGDYSLGRLPAGQRLVVARHLRDCPYCGRELALYALTEPGASAEVGDLRGAVKVGLRSLIGRVSWAHPAPAALPALVLRGNSSAPQVHETEDVRVVLHVQPATSGYRRKRLLGKVEPAGAAIGAELWSEAELLDSITVEGDGYFFFDRLKSGRYILCLRGDGGEVWLEVNVGLE